MSHILLEVTMCNGHIMISQLQLPSVPEFYPADGRLNQVAGRAEFSLPQIHTKPYHHHQHIVGSGIPSGHTSMATSNKSTSHSHFLPAIYEKAPHKVYIYIGVAKVGIVLSSTRLGIFATIYYLSQPPPIQIPRTLLVYTHLEVSLVLV